MDIVVGGDGQLIASRLGEHLRTSSQQTTRIDLGRTTFVDPAGLVTVVAAAERAVAEGRTVFVEPPAMPDRRRYFSRMGVGEQLVALGLHDPFGVVRSHDLGDRLQEVRRFDTPDGLESVAQNVMDLLARAGEPVTTPLYNSMYEIADNAVRYSGRDGGYLVLQTYPQQRKVTFAVADSGVGLRQTLSRTVDVSGDAAAVAIAARRHVSSTGEAGRGRGISGVIEATGEHAGSVELASGSAYGLFTRAHWDPRVTTLVAPFLGTLVQGSLALGERMVR